MSSLIGRTLGQYEIVAELGQGGMAKVYKGYQESIDRHVAVKVLPPHPALDEQFKERFQLEARTIGSLQNPNILPLYDFGTEGDIVYLVMAYIEGGTLEDLIDSGPMDIGEVERILRNIASGLDYAHRKGVIHRDIKPANILMSDGHPLLADFGLVKWMAGSGDLTGTAIIGTPSYMAPEQGQGLDVDARVDIYALGAMVYEMLAGQQPYTGATPMQIIFKHINDPLPDILEARSDLSSELADVIEIAMAKDPRDRFSSAGAFAEAFSAALHQDSDSLVSVQKAYPISDESGAHTDATIRLSETLPQVADSGGATSQTIIVQNTNPLVLLGGFGLIALIIVIVALALISNQDSTQPPATTVAEATIAPTVPVVPEIPSFGDVFFSSVDALGDSVTLSVNELRQPTGDSQYAAWLMNTETDEWLLLDRLVVDSFGRGTLNYIDSEGRMLPVDYNALVITEETEIGETPNGDIVYNAQVLASVGRALKEILVTSENGIENRDGTFTSLLDGASVEIGFAQQHAGLAANSTNLGGLQTHSEHTINIINGAEDDYDGNGRGSNPGRGIGVFFFLDTMQAVLDDAIMQDNSTIDLQVNAENIKVCIDNVRLWANEIVQLETQNFSVETIEAVADDQARATLLAEQLTAGFDANSDGRIDAFEGECGLNQILGFALESARMNIIEGGVE
ncbi:MAG: serine/threonine-protein kinase [Anaerolineae bacterium]|nr:serine/threonine-protein kinase [Anaerolineae bacterium]